MKYEEAIKNYPYWSKEEKEEFRTIENMRKARLLAEVQMTKLMNDVQNEEEHKND